MPRFPTSPRQWLLGALAGALQASQLWGAEPPSVRYRLRATVDDGTGTIEGSAEILYLHHGPQPATSLLLLVGRSKISELRLAGAPIAPGSLIASGDSVRLSLPRPVASGDTLALSLTWTTRLETAPGAPPRHLELSDWYPRIADEVSHTSVRVAPFATVLLRLDVANDQVVGGTGVPLCGDPGWGSAAAFPSTRVTLQRAWYSAPRDRLAQGAECGGAAAGRKVITWYAEDVMAAVFALSPTFRYEEGDFLERPVHAFYERGEEHVWGAGLATRRAEAGMAWTLELGGRYPWPHLSVIHAFGRRDEAAPMVLLADTPRQAALLDLLGLLMTQQVIGGGARVFTVSVAAYQTAWFFEALGRRGDYARLERQILDWDLDGLGLRDEPLADSSAAAPCATTLCRRTEFMSYQLRQWAGSDAVVRRLYASVYGRFMLRPVPPGAFQGAAAELVQPSPDPLYAQLPRGGVLFDDAITAARREPLPDGGWRTRVTVRRRAAGLFPQTLWVIADSDTVAARAAALTPAETLSVVTRGRPRRALLDPLARSHDWNMLNNQRVFGAWSGWLLLAPHRHLDTYLDTYFTRHTTRDRLTVGIAPTVWKNDVGGWTFGGRIREDYLGRFELNDVWLSLGTGWGAELPKTVVNGRVTVRNPIVLRSANWSQELGLAWEEGRAAATVEWIRRFRSSVRDATNRTLGVSLGWLGVTDPAFLEPRSWDDAGTVELTVSGTVSRAGGAWPVRLTASAAGGYAYPNAAQSPPAAGYGRFLVEGSVRRPLSRRVSLGLRGFAGAVASGDSLPHQRLFALAGADPYQRFGSPFLRSRGSLLSGAHYHAPGGAGLRGLDHELAAPHALGSTVELEYALYHPQPEGWPKRVALAAFADGALADGDLSAGRSGLASAADAGLGLRLDLRLGRTPFQGRLDLPLWVSLPALAEDTGVAEAFGFRWTFSFTPAF